MAIKLFEMFGVSLALTLLIELVIGWCFGMRARRQILLVVLVNILTNPAAVMLHWLGMPQIPIEILVMLAEAAVYWLFSRDESWNIRYPVWMSVICNAVSWTGGILIQRIGG